MTRKRTITHIALALTAAGTVGLATQDAEACGGGWWVDPVKELEYRETGIARAEKEMQEGRYDDAAATVLRVIPHIGKYDAAPKDKVIQRAMRVLALATARKDGKLEVNDKVPSYAHDFVAGTFLKKGDKSRASNLKWAVASLSSMQKEKKDDAVLQAELGEALAKTDDGKAKGRDMLEKLAKKDLLSSPEAYRALAELRADAGDADGRVAALNRCKAMAKDAAVCTVSRTTGHS